ncbi:MAG: amidohydrolase family protein, partial [Gemmatimonadales bacterium]
LIWVPSQRGGTARMIASLPAGGDYALADVVKQIYPTADWTGVHIGLWSWGWDGSNHPPALVLRGQDGIVRTAQEAWFLDGVFSPNGRRVLITIGNTLYEVGLPIERRYDSTRVDTLDLGSEAKPFGGPSLAMKRWGTALKPWISWSSDGRRVAFAQGGVLYVGDVPSHGWITWQRVKVPLGIPPDQPQGTLAFRGAALITMRGREIIEHGDLVIVNNRIAAVGPSGHVPIPKDARIVEAQGMTILPGYVDIHEHGSRPHGVHPQQSWISLLELANGVTTVRDPFSHADNEDFAYADRERAGDFLSPRMFSTGVPYLGPYPPIRTLDQARDAVRRNAEDFRTETFKVYTDFTTDRRARQLLATAARQAGLNATVHTNGGDHALTSAIDGFSGIEHQPGIKIYDDVATLIARTGATYTQTYLASLPGSKAVMADRYGAPLDYPKVRRFVPPSERDATCSGCTGEAEPVNAPVTLDNLLPIVSGAARIVARGGRIGMGSHGNMVGIGFHYEMWLHALGGMPNLEILRAATITGATAIGHARDLGSLEPGKLADLQVLMKNPLEDIHQTTSIRYIMKNGRLYQADDLTQVWPQRKRLAATYLWAAQSSLR